MLQSDLIRRKSVAAESLALLVSVVVLSCPGHGPVAAQGINPQAIKVEFEKAKGEAELVAKVRVLAAVCTETGGEGKSKTAALKLALQVLDAEKGPAKKNAVLVVHYNVNLPSGPGPGMYGYQTALRSFPFTPGVKGEVALRWDKERREYAVVAGWVAELNNAPIPTEVGKAFVAGDPAVQAK